MRAGKGPAPARWCYNFQWRGAVDSAPPQAAQVSKDIGPILEGWPHEPRQISVRRIRGPDGRMKIQLRLDLGLLQMEARGRPDGQRPYGCESVLAYLEKQLKRHRDDHGSEDGFGIDEKQCELLRAEGIQYYYRYLSEFVLEEYEAVARDTDRNLRVLDFCAKYAIEEPDRYIMEQYRPYVLMMNTRAEAHMALRDKRPRAARDTVLAALEKLREYFSRFGQEELYDDSSEVVALKALLKDVQAKIPEDPVHKLKRQLAKAIEEERYEDAARLRDAILRTVGEGRQ